MEIEIARAAALRDATIAFQKVDISGDGQIDQDEVEKLIKDLS